jgi:hypothetical protein
VELICDVGLTSSSPKKVVAPTRNNGRTSAIDCGGYGPTFDVILSPRVGFLVSHDRTRFI